MYTLSELEFTRQYSLTTGLHRYVWLRAHKANNPRDLVTSVSTAIVDSARDGQSDLAAGAGGSYRYFETARDAGASR